MATDDDALSERPAPGGGGLHTRVVELINESSGLARPSADWSGPVALELVERLLDTEQAQLSAGSEKGVRALNLALYRMSYEVALACEHAQQLGALARHPAAAFDPADGVLGGSHGRAATMLQRLRSAPAARGEDPAAETAETVGQLARLLCLGLIDAHEARDRYDYVAMETALDACDNWLPSGYTLRSLRVLACLGAVAQAGLSRDEGGAPPSCQALGSLEGLVSEDRNRYGEPCVDHAVLLLVSAVGHMRRRDLVKEAELGRADSTMSRVDWILDVLQRLKERGVAEARDWPAADQHNPIAHHVHYYRYFAHQVRAIALANRLKDAAETRDETEDAPIIAISDVRKEYRQASAFLEHALQSVHPSNESRWRYYDVSAENLEHEESLRIELLEQSLSTRQTIESLAETKVQQFSSVAQEELRRHMADVSMRIVEIIGVFLAVIAILGATVASATVDDLSLGGRIVILAVGGSMPVVYFALLRLIVTGKASRRRSRDQDTA